MTALLAIDVGTTGLRAAIVDDSLRIRDIEYRPCAPSTPMPGLVEFDAAAMASTVLDAVGSVVARCAEPITAVGITNQRASCVVWDRMTGVPVGPGLGWQDLRTIGDCMVAKAEHGWAFAPNQSVTKLSWILTNSGFGGNDELSGRALCFGTIDTWIAWTLSEGAVHVSDHTNASATITGLRLTDGSDWNQEVLDAFGIPRAMLPAVVDSIGSCGSATRVAGSPPIAGLLGDQQASLIGQGCVAPGQVKITFGTGGMLDVATGSIPPTVTARSAAGTYPLPLWSERGVSMWGVEAIMLSAGTNVEWLRDDLGLIETSADSHEVAGQCTDSGGVMYVPALLGLGTPHWDYGARGTLLGVTRGTGRPHVVRAVLEGIAHRGADLLDAAIADTHLDLTTLRIDGGMSVNPTFVQALADATGRPIEVSPVAESTTIGAAFVAGLGAGVFGAIADVDALWRPAEVIDPSPSVDREAIRGRWHDAVERSRAWYPELSSLDF